MNWLDIILGFVLVGVAVIEACRGFGRAIFDALALYGALWATELLGSIVDTQFFHADTALNHALTYGVLFATLTILAFILSRFLYNTMLINAGMFDGLLGLCVGIGVAMILAHGFVRLLSIATPATPVIYESFLGNEMLSFTTYHQVLAFLAGTTANHRTIPNVNG